MPKLDDAKVRWIIREMERGERTEQEIGQVQDVTRQRVSQLWNEYKQTGKIPSLQQPGRPAEPLSTREQELIDEAYQVYRMGARMLEDILQRDYGVKISHNKIHRYMRRNGMASRNRKKQQKRQWVRWERQHSMSLWHTDYKWLSSLKKWIIAYQDDASRHVMGHALVDTETTANAIQLLDNSIQQWGKPREVLTDQGTQFYAAGGEKKQKGLSRFERHCRELDIHHIVGRISHPQTNGKIERLYRTLENKLPLFDHDMDQTVHWYNHVKPHMSLIFQGHYDTPHNAFYRKLPPERIMQYANGWLWNGIT